MSFSSLFTPVTRLGLRYELVVLVVTPAPVQKLLCLQWLLLVTNF
jgi:hypothetical protein